MVALAMQHVYSEPAYKVNVGEKLTNRRGMPVTTISPSIIATNDIL